MLTVTPQAINRIRELLPNPLGKGLRISVHQGGCSGHQYDINIDIQHEKDEVIDCGNGVLVFVDATSLPLLKGCQVDFYSSLTKAGFRINNPNARQTCGCGTSFEA